MKLTWQISRPDMAITENVVLDTDSGEVVAAEDIVENVYIRKMQGLVAATQFGPFYDPLEEEDNPIVAWAVIQDVLWSMQYDGELTIKQEPQPLVTLPIKEDTVM